MQILIIILAVATAVFSIYSLVKYIRKRSGMLNEHRQIMASLRPARSAYPDEREKLAKLYRLRLKDGETPLVYRHSGPVGYISITVNHVESKEWTFGGIKVAAGGIELLKKVLPGVDFTRLASDTDRVSRERVKAIVEKNKDAATADEEKIKEELKNALEEFTHQFEIVFPGNDINKPGFLVKFDDWSLEKTPDDAFTRKRKKNA